MITPKCEIAAVCIDIAAAAGVEGAKWERFQLRFLNNQSRLSIDVKARQIAWSFTAAVDAMIDAYLNPDTPHIFVSINKEEASEKIRYAMACHEAWRTVPGYPPPPRIVRQNTFEIELENGSRLLSHPCRPPRGKARTRIYLDEMAHYHDSLSKAIYTAALPATVKGDGYIRIGSSPLGASGLFWDIVTQSTRSFPGYVRSFIPWWEVAYLCQDTGKASEIARLPTAERVTRYGTAVLVELFHNMFLEDFMQEFECNWVDESVAWISWETIKKCQDGFGNGVFLKSNSLDSARKLIDQIKNEQRHGRIEPVLVGGLDIGRTHDRTELIILGKTTTGQLPLRANVTFHQAEYDDQRDVLLEIINELPFTQVLIDRNGIGANLAESLQRMTRRRAQGVDFTNPNKELWAIEARIQAERGNVPLPLDREIAYQIHSIKKCVTAAKNNVFDAVRNEQGHADKFWAWALAVWAGAEHREKGGGIVF